MLKEREIRLLAEARQNGYVVTRYAMPRRGFKAHLDNEGGLLGGDTFLGVGENREEALYWAVRKMQVENNINK